MSTGMHRKAPGEPLRTSSRTRWREWLRVVRLVVLAPKAFPEPTPADMLPATQVRWSRYQVVRHGQKAWLWEVRTQSLCRTGLCWSEVAADLDIQESMEFMRSWAVQ